MLRIANGPSILHRYDIVMFAAGVLGSMLRAACASISGALWFQNNWRFAPGTLAHCDGLAECEAKPKQPKSVYSNISRKYLFVIVDVCDPHGLDAP